AQATPSAARARSPRHAGHASRPSARSSGSALGREWKERLLDAVIAVERLQAATPSNGALRGRAIAGAVNGASGSMRRIRTAREAPEENPDAPSVPLHAASYPWDIPQTVAKA